MTFIEWLSSTEAGFAFYPAFLLLFLLIAINVAKSIRLRRRTITRNIATTSTIAASSVLLLTLLGYFFNGYKQSLAERYSKIDAISKRVFGAELNHSDILSYTMLLMSRNFYFQVEFNEPHLVSESWVSKWERCSNASDFSKSNPEHPECYAYYIRQRNLPPKEKNCSVDPNHPFYSGKAKIAFGADQYAEKNYSEAQLIGNKEMTAYCFYWSR